MQEYTNTIPPEPRVASVFPYNYKVSPVSSYTLAPAGAWKSEGGGWTHPALRPLPEAAYIGVAEESSRGLFTLATRGYKQKAPGAPQADGQKQVVKSNREAVAVELPVSLKGPSVVSRKAILIGCNYPGTKAELQGCVNDALAMQDLLKTVYGFQDTDITLMIDMDKTCPQPTGKNIKEKVAAMVASAKDGDELLIHFSGHGTQVPSDDPVSITCHQSSCISPYLHDIG